MPLHLLMTLAEQFKQYVKGGSMKPVVTIPTGSDLLDLVVSDVGGIQNGWIYNIIGDSTAGKTFLACELIAAAKRSLSDRFNVKIRYNDCESGFTFDTERLYGFELREDLVKSETIQDFFTDFDISIDELKPDDFMIYVVDSFDGLSSDDVVVEMDDRKKFHKDGKVYDKGSFNMAKQKHSSKSFAYISTRMAEKNVILVIISQIRDNVNASYGPKWTISGGHALKFYSSVRVFLRRVDSYTKTVDSQERDIGYTVRAEGIKVRSKTPYRKCDLDILYEYGLDNISSNIDFLYGLRTDTGKLRASEAQTLKWDDGSTEQKEDVSKDALITLIEDMELMDSYLEFCPRKTEKKLKEFVFSVPEALEAFTKRFGAIMNKDELITYIETNNLEEELTRRVKAKWNAIEEAVRPVRKGKY